LLAAAVAAVPSLDQAKSLLDEFRMQEALELLDRARAEGPYVWADHVRLEELSGIAYAYLGRADEAQAAFERLLALDPRHAVSYTLSPKVTFVFERARERWETRARPALEISWPAELAVGVPVPIDIEVAADPNKFFSRATLHYRVRGEAVFSAMDVELAAPGTRVRVLLPPTSAEKDTTLEIYLIARNSRGDEVHSWYSAKEPRDLLLRFVPPEAWYGEWWVWVAVGGVVAAASVGAALVATYEPDRSVDGIFRAQ
jgi:tetratricopeptide (TPR) repeat protein